MRALIRYIATGLFATLGIVVGTVFRLNIEDAATSSQWHSILREWSIQMPNSSWLLYSFLVSLGVVLTLWTDYAIRRHFERKKKYPIVRIGWEVKPELASDWNQRISSWVDHCFIYTGKDAIYKERNNDPKLSKFGAIVGIVFELDAYPPYDVTAFSSRSVLWKISRQGRHFISLEFDLLSRDEVELELIIASGKRFGNSSGTEMYQWHESNLAGNLQLFVPQDNSKIDNSILPVRPKPLFPDWWDIKVKRINPIKKFISRNANTKKTSRD